jgi:hypothetical protein
MMVFHLPFLTSGIVCGVQVNAPATVRLRLADLNILVAGVSLSLSADIRGGLNATPCLCCFDYFPILCYVQLPVFMALWRWRLF